MVNPGAFQGSRREFLLSQKDGYSQAVADGHAAEVVAHIQRKYFKRFPVDLPHDEEPTPEHLAAVDDDAIDPDYKEPDSEKLSPEDYTIAMAKLEVRQRTLVFRKAQIKRWLAYQHMKDHDLDPTETGAHNPYRPLLFKLTGKGSAAPRLKTPVNVWRISHRDEIEKTLKIRAIAQGTQRAGLAKLREEIARELFGKLDDNAQRSWRAAAMDEHAVATAAWKLEMESPPSKDPEERQKCIMGLVRFAQPILDLISEATGWKASLIAGGPEPAHDGRLGILSVHSGSTTGDVPMNFGRSERLRYKAHIVPIYGSFLQKCYSPEECRSRALNREEGYMPMETLDLNPDEVSFDSIGQPSSVDPPNRAPERHGSVNADSTSQDVQPALSAPTTSLATPSTETTVIMPPVPAPLPLHSADVRSTVPSPPPSPIHSASAPSPPPSLPPSPGGGHSPAPSPPPSPAQSFPLAPASPSSINPVCPTSAPPFPSAKPGGPASPTKPPPPSAILKRGGGGSRGRKRAREGPDQAGGKSIALSEPDEPQPPLKRRHSERPSGKKPAEVKNPADASKARRQPTRKNKGAISAPCAVTSPPASSHLDVRTASTSTAPPLPSTPADAPQWFSNALAMFRHEDVGKSQRWCEMVDAWVALEVKSGYKEVSRLKSTKRPVAISEWIARARAPTWRPAIANVDQYGTSFLAWWTALQPGWRLSVDRKSINVDATGGDWESLRKPGLNGLVSVVAALFYWGCAVQAANEGQDDWLAAVDDCLTVYTHLIRS